MSNYDTTQAQAGPAGETINSLAARAQGGDRRAVNELLRRLKTLCLEVGKKYVSIEADDQVQLGWIAIDHCVRSWAPERGAFRTLAKTAVKNAFVSEIRKGRDSRGEAGVTGYHPKSDASFHIHCTDEILEELPSPDFQGDVQRKLDFAAALAVLPPIEQFVVTARRLGVTMHDIADQLPGIGGASTSKVQTIENSAIRHLRKILAPAA